LQSQVVVPRLCEPLMLLMQFQEAHVPPAADLNSASSRGRRFTELLADEADRSEIEVVVVDVERSATEEPRRRLEDRVAGPDRDDQRPWRRHLVLTDLDVLGDGDSLTFVEHTKPVALFDPEVLDRVLRFIPALHVRTFVHDQGAEVPRVEHDNVSRLRGNIEPGR
jgi:hypothetical protein